MNSALIYVLTGMTCSNCGNDLIYVLIEAYEAYDYKYMLMGDYSGGITVAMYPHNYNPSGHIDVRKINN